MKNPTVFIISDDSSVHSGLFEQARLHCETFATAGEFLAEFDIDRPGCLLLDLSVLEMGGADFHRILVQRQIINPVIILMHDSDMRHAMEMLKRGALDFFERPFDHEALLIAVNHALEMDSANRRFLHARSEVQRRFAQLTQREREILRNVLESKSSREIAVQLNMSARTVEFHRAKVMKKMGVASPLELARMAATAFACHCVHKDKYSQGGGVFPSIFPSFLNHQVWQP